jgi:hypothetical protein
MNLSAHFIRVIFFVFIVLISGCQSQRDLAALEAEILQLHQMGIDAHLNKDIDFFCRDISEDYVSVSGGEINKPTVAEIQETFRHYLGTTVFTQYEDLQDPIVGVSQDGSLAWSIVQVKVAGRKISNGDPAGEIDFTCAWITLYERQGDRWQRLADVSSFK